MAEEDHKRSEPGSSSSTSSLCVDNSHEDHALVNREEKVPVPNPVDQEVADPVNEKTFDTSFDRDTMLAKVEMEKRLALIKAWEENAKAIVDNKAYKRHSSVGTWENRERASVESRLKKIEEKLEKKRAEYAERMNNKIAEIHKAAEEKRAMIEAKRGEDVLKIEEKASKFRAAGYIPRKFLACFNG
ncbi:hypothetical protein Ddye_002651 [Dipteronia dyeriana]|uniref:Remorin C-terminal domain-containing protein n=1 Tax=Dipteronia dyeriana TaxID=168575 RepID=A0AAE0CUL0_9ROSI|nr:hypothetical protein Ddye_002651 [Dipteronia dyeriana]